MLNKEASHGVRPPPIDNYVSGKRWIVDVATAKVRVVELFVYESGTGHAPIELKHLPKGARIKCVSKAVDFIFWEIGIGGCRPLKAKGAVEWVFFEIFVGPMCLGIIKVHAQGTCTENLALGIRDAREGLEKQEFAHLKNFINPNEIGFDPLEPLRVVSRYREKASAVMPVDFAVALPVIDNHISSVGLELLER